MTSQHPWTEPILWPFQPHALDASCVVYAIWATRHGETRLLYVGQTASRLVDRIGAHFGSRCLIEGFDAYRDGSWGLAVSYLQVDGAPEQAAWYGARYGRRTSRLLLEAERATIAAWRPLLNRPEVWARRAAV